MKKLIWAVIIAFGLACLPFGGSAVAGQKQGKAGHKTVAHAGKAKKSGKARKHFAKKHRAKHAAKHHKSARA